jgi:signal transduction histidine kinase
MCRRFRIAIELRPTALEDLGVVPALQTLVEQWSLTTRIPAEFGSIGMDNERFSELVQTTLYRVVQETLTNITRHAGTGPDKASRVGVTLQLLPHRLQLIVEDDGPGFDVEAVGELGRLGVAGMRERAAACGGTLEIESAPGEGTTIYLRIPAELL